jgi:hypothetical protein
MTDNNLELGLKALKTVCVFDSWRRQSGAARII